MARKDPTIERLGDVLEISLKRLDLNARLDDYGVWTIWNDTVGTAIARPLPLCRTAAAAA